jgi:translation initiation factor IF-2
VPVRRSAPAPAADRVRCPPRSPLSARGRPGLSAADLDVRAAPPRSDHVADPESRAGRCARDGAERRLESASRPDPDRRSDPDARPDPDSRPDPWARSDRGACPDRSRPGPDSRDGARRPSRPADVSRRWSCSRPWARSRPGARPGGRFPSRGACPRRESAPWSPRRSSWRRGRELRSPAWKVSRCFGASSRENLEGR